jgi:predicted amidohydrolase YtcJ
MKVEITARALGSAVLLALTSGGLAAAQAAPDMVVYNAKIVTVDGQFSVAQAAAITGGRFSKVGANSDVLATAGPRTVKVDLHGRTVLPGFNDTHIHQLGRAQSIALSVDLTRIRSIADIQKAIAERAKAAKPGEWITGTRGWWEYELSDNRIPDRFDLDKVAPNNPVTIPGPHYTVVNSMALKLAGITRDSKDPQGGEIRKDPRTGEPTGLLFDNASRPVSRLLPKPSPAQVRESLLRIMRLNNSNGLTSIGEPSGSVEDLELYQALHKEGLLTTRVDFAFSVDPALPPEEAERQIAALGAPGHASGDGMIRADELGEVGLDGAEETALLRNDYPDRPGYRGLEKVPQQRFNEFAAISAKYGYRLRPHAVGDAAIDEALTAFEYADARAPIGQRRWMIDHAFLLLPDHYPRVKKLGVMINSQYMHNAQLGKLILDAWKRPLADKSENYKDWVANGILFANGSDGPISYFAEPIYEIYGSVTRKTRWGGSLGPDQGLSREDAIRSVTINGAYSSFEEKVKGSIEPGKYADFVVLSDDILTVNADRIKDIKVLATVLGGKTVYGDVSKR